MTDNSSISTPQAPAQSDVLMDVTAQTPEHFDSKRLAQAIDHTKLVFAPEENETAAIEQLCNEAAAHGFYAVCVRPQHVTLAKSALQDSTVRVATVIGFPAGKVRLSDEQTQPTIGAAPFTDKVHETLKAVADGADELDLVIDVALLKAEVQSGRHELREELSAIRDAAAGVPIKVIIETDLLTNDEIVKVTEWCAKTGMAMVKTSTGMVEGGQGATLEVVNLIAQTLKRLNVFAVFEGAPSAGQVGIKASGGIKTRAQAMVFLEAGASRLGTSAGSAIVEKPTQDNTSEPLVSTNTDY